MSEAAELWRARLEAHIAVALTKAEYEAVQLATTMAEKEAGRVFMTGGEDAEAYRAIVRELWERGMDLWKRQGDAQRQETEAYDAYSKHLAEKREGAVDARHGD